MRQSCGVTLIPAQRKEGIGPKDDPSRLEWLLSHEIHYPDLGDLENVQYVVGYAPKTGQAAADIRKKHFRGAKLVLINHACPEPNCLQAEEYGLSEFEEKMLQMASEADILFSIGPRIYNFFHNAYGAEVQDRVLSGIPHEKLLPLPDKCFWKKEPKERKVTQHHILTCGQMDTQEAIERCKPIAASVGSAAKRCGKPSEWKIVGVSKQAGKSEQISLEEASKTQLIHPQLQPEQSTKSLLTSLQQSHLCLPAPCYWDYSFYGLEAMVFGLPTSVHNDSHLAHAVKEHLKMNVDCYVVGRRGTGKLTEKISQHLKDTSEAFKKAKALKTAMIKSEDFTNSFAKFAALLKRPAKTDSCKDLEEMVHAKPAMEQVPRSTSENSPTQFETVNESIQSQTTGETYGELMEAESGQETTLLSERKENETPSNCNDEQQDCLVKVALDKEVQLRQQQEMKRNEMEAAMVKCEHGLKRRVQAVLAHKDSSNEVKEICKEKVGLTPKTLATGCLGIVLKILTLYYFYRLKQTCRSRNLAKALEPLLITDEMRDIAAEVGIKLQLKALYDTATFKKIEHFFINRDGGGIHPIKFQDDDDDDAMQQTDDHLYLGEEPQLEQQAAVGGQAVEKCKTNLEQSNGQSKLLLLSLDPEHEIKLSTETSVQTMFKAEKCIRLKGRQCDMLQVLTTNTDTVQHILSCRQDVLALLSVTRYLLTDATTQNMDTQEFEEQLVKEGTQVIPVKNVDERVSSLVRSLLLFQTSDIQVTQYLIGYLLALGQTVTKSKMGMEKIILECRLDEAEKVTAALEEKIRDLLKRSDSKSEFDVEKRILESKLNEALREKAALQEQMRDLSTRSDSVELEKRILESQLNEAKKEMAALEEQIGDLLKRSDSKSELDVEKRILKSQLNEAKREKAVLEEQIGDLLKKSEGKELEFIRQTSDMQSELLKKEEIIGDLLGRLSKVEDPYLTPLDLRKPKEEFEHQYGTAKKETEASGLHQPDETERSKTEYSRMMETEHEQHGHPTHPHTDMPTFRKRQLEADQKKEALPEKKPRSTDSGIKTSHGAEASITSVTKDSTGQWSRRIINGHQGQKFKDVRGLAFHNDKLLVCDRDNNIVHILNKDYTCEKELGSFSGQFAKPFKPQSIAVSQDNLYFILDDSNVQIVVCDQNNKVIRIITLPTDSDPRCIALGKGFVIVTEVNGHRVLKYSQTGQYIAECLGGHQDDRQTPFSLPYFVAVNSRDVIMVSDCYNHCIKCFDAQFNFLYQYGHRGHGDSQLSHPLSIAVDGADHVYVCDHNNDRISIWSEDRTCIGHLFHRQVRLPWYMAVTADGDRIAVRGYPSDEIYVFSK
ncbi:uncharacterized protein [Ptychodera flava]|uniref:uncharacterized protein n=1 Tax=Ptychodera flava TaxID=63121 RepID=UPI003969CB0B